MSAVTIEEVKRHLKITGTEDDALLAQKIEAAEDYIQRFIGTAIASIPVTEEGGKLTMKVPAGLKDAILRYVEFLVDGAPVDLAEALTPYREYRF